MGEHVRFEFSISRVYTAVNKDNDLTDFYTSTISAFDSTCTGYVILLLDCVVCEKKPVGGFVFGSFRYLSDAI